MVSTLFCLFNRKSALCWVQETPLKSSRPESPWKRRTKGHAPFFHPLVSLWKDLSWWTLWAPPPCPASIERNRSLLLLHEGSLWAKAVLLHPPALTPPQGSGWRYWAVRVASPQLALPLCLSFFLPAISLCPRLCPSAWERIPWVGSTQVGVASGCPTLPVTQGGQVSNSSIKYQQVSLATDSWLSLSFSFIGN